MENLIQKNKGPLIAMGSAAVGLVLLLVISAIINLPTASESSPENGPTLGNLLFWLLMGGLLLGGYFIIKRLTNRPSPPPNDTLPKARAPWLCGQNDDPETRGISHDATDTVTLIEDTLASFNVPVKVIGSQAGPRVTQFYLKPEKVNGKPSKVSAIKALNHDLSLALNASVRINTRPGKLIIEIPHEAFDPVMIERVIESGEGMVLPVALGLDVAGEPIAIDLTEMPHALVAGATGGGKSVCINAAIASLLMHLTPDELQLLMIDPKMVELVQYEGIPHLVTPVITDMQQAAGALRWAVSEMDRRYKLLSQARQRKISAYNEWAKANREQVLPYLVIVIDELADLMMQYQEEVEPLIVRLAQMARAVGIHAILATQRPSVDVVTGLIKANIPTRIGFAVASSTDSRVILDCVGAEALLGRGDMLYLAAGTSQPQRIQGCFIDDDALSELVTHWKNSAFTSSHSAFDSAFLFNDRATDSATDSGKRAVDSSAHSDELLPAAIALLEQHDSVSTSFLQRKLRIGYVRAARIMDTLKEDGLIELADEQRPSTASRHGAAPAPTSNSTNRATALPTENMTASKAHEQRIAELEAQLATVESGLSWNEVWPVVARLFSEVQALERVNMKSTKDVARALGATVGRDVWQKGTWRDLTAALALYHNALPYPTEKEAPHAPETAENEAVDG